MVLGGRLFHRLCGLQPPEGEARLCAPLPGSIPGLLDAFAVLNQINSELFFLIPKYQHLGLSSFLGNLAITT